MKIKSFTQLTVWQKAHKLALHIYKISKIFPREEKYGLIDQLRRAAVSVSSNIAEGFAKRSLKDKRHFYITATGSLVEIQNQILLSRDLGYVSNENFKNVAIETVEIHKMLNGLVKSLSKEERS